MGGGEDREDKEDEEQEGEEEDEEEMENDTAKMTTAILASLLKESHGIQIGRKRTSSPEGESVLLLPGVVSGPGGPEAFRCRGLEKAGESVPSIP